ncbi:MAG: phospholipid carrier-dependent glycosyltransferase [Chloroflexi bacterium]|nr:phospholipid carrier-dependent glycosyltransferase [Chloroflexota bacterium]
MIQNLRYSERFQRWGIPILIFLLTFIPRAIYPVSWPMQWYNRAIYFGDALLARDWAGTYQQYHPGVTTMWLSGTGIKIFAWLRGLSSDQLLGFAPAKPGTINGAITAGVLPLVFVIALCVALSYVLLNRIIEQKVALVGSCLLALNPFYIAYSRVLHVNALLATFMFVSVLFLFNYLYRAKWLDLIWSGIFAGLAILTKSPSLFIIPYTALVVGAYRLTAAPGSSSKVGERRLWAFVRTLLVWGGAVAIVFIVLWPAMWVEPLNVMYKMIDGTFFHVETVHQNPVFFDGQVTHDDPGMRFYLATIAWKTTLVTLPMACAALVFAWPRFRRGKHNFGVILGWLIVYVVCFTTQMGLGSWKQVSYVLPVFLALDVIASLGLVQSAVAIARIRWWQKWRWLPTTFIVLVLVLQAAIVLSYHPYYGTHHNVLLGGSRVAQHILPLQDQGEGLDLAAQYLNTLPRAQRASAWLHQRSAAIFRRNFVGLTETEDNSLVDYRVYYVNQIVRRLGYEEWGEMWEVDRQTTPLWSIDFDGITYIWIYGVPPGEPAAGGPEHSVDYQLGEHIQLGRVHLSAETLAPGDVLTVVLLWESDGQVERSYKVFCHIVSKGGELVAQQDGIPLHGVRPTSSWRAGEAIEDSYEILLNGDLAPGEYKLTVGMYDAETMERLMVYSAGGERLADDHILLGHLSLTYE